ncbi:MAG: cytochrome P450 [Myxococcota bacterium]
MTSSVRSESAAPIELALLPSQGIAIPDYHGLMRRLRTRERISPVTFAGRPSWLVTRHADVLALLEDETRFSSRALHEANSFPVMGRNLMGMEGDAHRIHKALVAPPFRRSRVESHYVEPILRPLCHELIDRFADRREVDLVAEFTKGFPLTVIARLLGLPIEDERRFSRWAMALIAHAFLPDEAREAALHFDRFLAPLLEARRRAPGDDLLSMLAHAEVEGARLDDELALSFVRVLFAAGTDTTYNAVGALIHALLTHPEALERVRADRALLPAAVEEGLRWNGPIGVLPRILPADAEWLGVKMPAGSTILAGLSAATRDPSVYDDPDRFELDRRSKHQLAFGWGQHYCLGAHLARAELVVALDVLLERLPRMRLLEEPRFVGCVIRGPERLRVALSGG